MNVPQHDPDTAPDIFAVGEYQCPDCGLKMGIKGNWPCSIVRVCCGRTIEVANIGVSP